MQNNNWWKTLSESPDMNPIEHIWATMGTVIRNGPNPPTNPAEMEAALRQEWNANDQWTIKQLIFSMHRRCAAVIDANSGSTKY